MGSAGQRIRPDPVWTWADEAMAHFERQLADGWEYDEDPLADHPFGAYYHWCALLCGFSEAALEHGLLSELQLEALRPALEASLPGLRACRRFEPATLGLEGSRSNESADYRLSPCSPNYIVFWVGERPCSRPK